MQGNRSLLLIASATFLLGVAPVNAGLKWDARQIDLKPRPVDAVAEAKFAFVNAGAEAVIIESVKSSCGCTVPTLEKTTYAAGERGELVARFTIGERRGFQSANIQVSIKGEPEPVALTLNVTIPEAAKLTPALLVWGEGVGADSKTIDVEAFPGEPMQVAKVTTSSPEFKAKIETIEKNGKYRIVVTPGSTERPAFAMLDIETRIVDGTKILHAFAQVRGGARLVIPPDANPR